MGIQINNDRQIDTLSTEAKRLGDRCEATVAGTKGLLIRAYKSGSVSYFFSRRVKGHKHPVRRKLGDRPALSLSMAKEKFKKALRELEAGKAPLGIRKRTDGDMLIFRELVTSRLKFGEPLAAGTIRDHMQMFEKDVYPAFGDQRIDEIAPRDIINLGDQIAERGSRVRATKTKNAISGYFKFATGRRLIDQNPCAGIPSWGKAKAREKIVRPADLRALWQLTETNLSPATRAIIRLAMLTGLRRHSIVGARKDEFTDLDTDKPLWVLPKAKTDRVRISTTVTLDNVKFTRTKNSDTHIVPLSKSAADLFRDAINISDHNEYVFPSLNEGTIHGHIDPHTVSTAMRRLCNRNGIEDLSIHDMRRAISRNLSDMSAPRRVIDLILHHVDDTTTGKHYPEGLREREYRYALELWHKRLQEIWGGHDGETALRWQLVGSFDLIELALNADAPTKARLAAILNAENNQ